MPAPGSPNLNCRLLKEARSGLIASKVACSAPTKRFIVPPGMLPGPPPKPASAKRHLRSWARALNSLTQPRERVLHSTMQQPGEAAADANDAAAEVAHREVAAVHQPRRPELPDFVGDGVLS